MTIKIQSGGNGRASNGNATGGDGGDIRNVTVADSGNEGGKPAWTWCVLLLLAAAVVLGAVWLGDGDLRSIAKWLGGSVDAVQEAK